LKLNPPQHIAIILDGNRRWAKERGLPYFIGHERGMRRAREIAEYAGELGVKILTVFAFSTENWKRSVEEKKHLFRIFEEMIDAYVDQLSHKKIRINILGDPKPFPERLRKKIAEVVKKTKNNKGLIFNIALNYGGRSDIVQAVKKIMSAKTPIGKVTERLINKNLYTTDQLPVDLLIRTSGEQRISNFVFWQAAYAELYFPKIHWPAFTKRELDKAINEYHRRERRFGGNSKK